jgi:hypothetical protein
MLQSLIESLLAANRATYTIAIVVLTLVLSVGCAPPVPHPSSEVRLNLGLVFYANLPSETDTWSGWSDDAYQWFDTWGVHISYLSDPRADDILTKMRDGISFYYGVAHGSYEGFDLATDTNGTLRCVSADEIEQALPVPIKFAFLASCGAMEKTGCGTSSYAFRKGMMDDTVTIGYAGIGANTTEAKAAWHDSLSWQDLLFRYITEGDTFYEAFCKANEDYPDVKDYVRFVGDENTSLEEILGRT